METDSNGKFVAKFALDCRRYPDRYYISRRNLLLMLRDRGYKLSDFDINPRLSSICHRYGTYNKVGRLGIIASHVSDSQNKVQAVYCQHGVVGVHVIRHVATQITNKKSLSGLIIVVQNRLTRLAMQEVADSFKCKVEIFHMDDLLVDTTKHALKPMHLIVPYKEKEEEKFVFKINLDAKQGLQTSAPLVNGVEKNSESPGGNLENTFGDSVTTDAEDKGKRKIESSEIKSSDSKRNKLMAMFNEKRKCTDVSKKVIDPPVTDKGMENMVPVTHVEKPVEVAALNPIMQTGAKQGSKSGDAAGSSVVDVMAKAHVQEQTNKDISEAVSTALATLVSYCPEICRRLELEGKQSEQVMAEKRKMEAEVERLQKLVADLRQSCTAETLLRMKTELELSEMKKKFITDQEKHAKNFHEKIMALTEKTEALTEDVTRLREDRRWLIAEGIPRSFEVIRSSEEYMEALTELTTTADLVGRQDGMVDGFKLCKDGGRVEDHHNYRKDARDELANAYEALSDMELPILNKLTATVESDDLGDLKALLASPGRDDDLD